eukprot:CAMPEP_0194238920 /NCGR_PEP_ID=MMETSP0158-20130606/5539_1 /TAXON_ID=33649 /ORGANISM="Thalassionema nitzschioides, Strain L26-B" /LENGTH=48 /DNA_ID= /DNA_START= /DNA_END= /DNA_ORIENTATION=
MTATMSTMVMLARIHTVARNDDGVGKGTYTGKKGVDDDDDVGKGKCDG